MANFKIVDKAKRACHRTGLLLKKHSPEILVVGGVVGTVTATVMACKATTRLDEILADGREQLEQMHEVHEKPELLPKGKTYSEEDYKKDLTIVYTQQAIKVAKLYAPAVFVGTLSITAILAGHNITRKRNVALAAAYTAVDKSFKEYRERVIERFGKELDHELRYNIKEKEVEEKVVNEDGTETIIKKVAKCMEPGEPSMYARIWYDGNPGWTKDPELNLAYLKAQQRYANDKLKSRGHLFLNEVYDMLGYDRTEYGQVVGWIYDENMPNGDNYVDFGFMDINRPDTCRFVNGDERNVLLDLNCDGVIYNLI